MSDVTGKAFGWDLKKSIDIDLKKVDITVTQVRDGKISSCNKGKCQYIEPSNNSNSQIKSSRYIIIIPSPNGKYMAVIGIGNDNKNENEYVELWEQKNQSWTKIEIDTKIDTKTITDMAFLPKPKSHKTSLIVATTNTDHKSLGLIPSE